jgi:hypothetical protein
MSKQSKQELTPLEALIAVVVLAFAFFYVYAVPRIEAWWAVYGLWVELGFFALITAAGVLFIYLKSASMRENREARARAVLEAEQRQRYSEEQRAKGLVEFTKYDGTSLWGTPGQVEGWRTKEEEENLPNRVVRAIKEFAPSRRYHNEFSYQTELQGWLKSRFPSSRIEIQTGASRPDIVIEDIAIEVKGPTDNRALDTLTTKCLKYSAYYKTVVLVLFEPEFSESNFREIEAGIERVFRHVFIIRKD